jgi:SAM-dependent methyltransferase
MTTGMYGRAEFERQQERSRVAAGAIIPLVLRATGARSVVDVGCGVGTWLAACAENGIEDYLGIDGYHVDADLLQIPRRHFRTADLREPLTFDRSYDLALSVEVAEHLPPETGPALVKQLTSVAPAVLFSAAVPGQTGPGHINERWQSYWAGLFASSSYFPVDEIRPAIWSLDEIPFWYRQNVILYLRRDRLPGDYAQPRIVDVVHPELLKKYVEMAKEERHISGRTAVSLLAKRVGNRLWRLTSLFSTRS